MSIKDEEIFRPGFLVILQNNTLIYDAEHIVMPAVTREHYSFVQKILKRSVLVIGMCI